LKISNTYRNTVKVVEGKSASAWTGETDAKTYGKLE